MPTSYGQTLLRQLLVALLRIEPIENYRPTWLHGLELDLYWPALGLAAEFQGDQHYVPVFGIPHCQRQQMNDRKKKRICAENRVALIRVRAIDLEYTRLRAMIKNACVGTARDWRVFKALMSRSDSKALSGINKLATSYRAILVKNFNSPSARRLGGLRVAATRDAWQAAVRNTLCPGPS